MQLQKAASYASSLTLHTIKIFKEKSPLLPAAKATYFMGVTLKKSLLLPSISSAKVATLNHSCTYQP